MSIHVTKQPKIIATRSDNRRYQLIVDGDHRYRVHVAVVRDHRDGHAIGFRSWVSPADVYESEDTAIAATLADIAILAESTNLGTRNKGIDL